MSYEDVAFALFNAALVDSERQLCPLVGVSADRRCLHNLSEVFTEDNIKTLVCFICGCKHVCCEGFDMFGKTIEEGYKQIQKQCKRDPSKHIGRGQT